MLQIKQGEDFRFNEKLELEKKRNTVKPIKMKGLKNRIDLDKLSTTSKGSRYSRMLEKSQTNARSGYLKRVSAKEQSRVAAQSVKTNDILFRLQELQEI
jgi:hypothetical protein